MAYGLLTGLLHLHLLVLLHRPYQFHCCSLMYVQRFGWDGLYCAVDVVIVKGVVSLLGSA